MTNYVYDPSFVKKYGEFYATYGEKDAPEKFKAWIKNTRLNPELPLDPQLAKKIGMEFNSPPPIPEINQTGTPVTIVDARTGGAEIQISADEYARQINDAWKNVQGRSPTLDERKQGITGTIHVDRPSQMTVWRDLKNLNRGEQK